MTVRALFTTWEGGGHVGPALTVAARLRARGAEVLVVSDEATRSAAARLGLPFEPWRSAPNRQAGGRADDPLDDWRARSPVGVVRAVCDSVMCRPAAGYAADARRLIASFRPDLVVTNELLFGVLLAAEREAVRTALLTGNLWCFPTRADLPPFGPAFPPARTGFEQRRERIARAMIARLYDLGLKDLNRAREANGLPPLGRTLDQLAAVELTLLGVSRAFDYDARPPDGFVYAGPLASPPAWATPGSPPVNRDPRPLVLVSFSTTYQREAPILARCVEALARLPVRAVVTLGPALADARLPGASNVAVVASASHDDLVPHCAAVVCHGGHGTLIRPIMAGVPVLAIPTGRDQPENARRATLAGAALTLPRSASARRIATAVGRLIEEPSFRTAAGALGRAVRAEADGGERAADALEALARAR